MKSYRLTVSAWQMLQRLSQDNTALIFDDEDGRFYFCRRGESVDLVRTSTFDALNSAGMVRRERQLVPSYVISDKGVSALRVRMLSSDLEDDENVIPRITIESQPATN